MLVEMVIKQEEARSSLSRPLGSDFSYIVADLAHGIRCIVSFLASWRVAQETCGSALEPALDFSAEIELRKIILSSKEWIVTVENVS